jgi:hypothetical protein
MNLMLTWKKLKKTWRQTEKNNRGDIIKSLRGFVHEG